MLTSSGFMMREAIYFIFMPFIITIFFHLHSICKNELIHYLYTYAMCVCANKWKSEWASERAHAQNYTHINVYMRAHLYTHRRHVYMLLFQFLTLLLRKFNILHRRNTYMHDIPGIMKRDKYHVYKIMSTGWFLSGA